MHLLSLNLGRLLDAMVLRNILAIATDFLESRQPSALAIRVTSGGQTRLGDATMMVWKMPPKHRTILKSAWRLSLNTSSSTVTTWWLQQA